VLLNLLTNAIKFTSENGTIRITTALQVLLTNLRLMLVVNRDDSGVHHRPVFGGREDPQYASERRQSLPRIPVLYSARIVLCKKPFTRWWTGLTVAVPKLRKWIKDNFMMYASLVGEGQ
jgi:hypothetical protein